MPIYSYKCPSCGRTFDRMLRLKNYQEPQVCECGATAEKVVVAPAVRADYAGYNCPVTGNWIEGKRAHEENLKKHGCRVFEPGEREAALRRSAQEDQEFERKLDATAEEFVAGLPAKKLEQLASEIDAGVSATVVRQ